MAIEKHQGLILLTFVFTVLLMSPAASFSGSFPENNGSRAGRGPLRVETLKENAGRASWSKSLDLIAFDYRGRDGFHDVYIMAPDGAAAHCLTCDSQGKPPSHMGQPAWHPGGRFLAFQREDPGLDKGRVSSDLSLFLRSPGIGINNNIWIMSADGRRYWQITHVESRLGVIHPRFSPDGSQLVWAEATRRTYNGLKWAIKLADFHIKAGTPVVTNIRTHTPGDFALYEVHDFSPDGQAVLFSASPGSRDFYHLEIYTFTPATGAFRQLTRNDEWDEHPHYSPDGRHIVWMSSTGNQVTRKNRGLLTDYWIMRKDGSGKRRLTYFNQPDAPEFIPGGVVAADCDWSPQGDELAAFLILKENKKYNLQRNTRLVKIGFDPDNLFEPK